MGSPAAVSAAWHEGQVGRLELDVHVRAVGAEVEEAAPRLHVGELLRRPGRPEQPEAVLDHLVRNEGLGGHAERAVPAVERDDRGLPALVPVREPVVGETLGREEDPDLGGESVPEDVIEKPRLVGGVERAGVRPSIEAVSIARSPNSSASVPARCTITGPRRPARWRCQQAHPGGWTTGRRSLSR